MDQRLYNYLKDEIAAVDAELMKDLPEDIILLQDVFKYLFNTGGKRLRPLMTVAIGKMTSDGEVNESNLCLAAAVELIHTATLLHDDVVDNAVMRRNQRAANRIWDNKTSILVGDNMFSKAFQLIVKSGKIRAFGELAGASATISAAEVWQLQLINKLDITIEDYTKLVTDKTAVLFGAACAAGAIANDCDDAKVCLARSFGINFGISYQIEDDWSDYTGDEKLMGKETFQDIREGKVTLPMVLLMQALREACCDGDLEEIKNIYNGGVLDKQMISELLEKFEIEEKVKSFSSKYSEAAMNNLAALNNRHEIFRIISSSKSL